MGIKHQLIHNKKHPNDESEVSILWTLILLLIAEKYNQAGLCG